MRKFICLVFVAGCSPSVPASVSVAPSTQEEKVVAAHVINTANEPGSVEFVKWGPHDLEKKLKVVRLVMRAKNEFGARVLVDYLFYVDGKEAGAFIVNYHRDQWKEARKANEDMIKFGGWGPAPPVVPNVSPKLVTPNFDEGEDRDE